MNAQLPIIDAATLRLALQDVFNPAIRTPDEDVRDMRRILANLSDETVRTCIIDAARVEAVKGKGTGDPRPWGVFKA